MYKHLSEWQVWNLELFGVSCLGGVVQLFIYVWSGNFIKLQNTMSQESLKL